jgi:hypothetical protein
MVPAVSLLVLSGPTWTVTAWTGIVALKRPPGFCAAAGPAPAGAPGAAAEPGALPPHAASTASGTSTAARVIQPLMVPFILFS